MVPHDLLENYLHIILLIAGFSTLTAFLLFVVIETYQMIRRILELGRKEK